MLANDILFLALIILALSGLIEPLLKRLRVSAWQWCWWIAAGWTSQYVQIPLPAPWQATLPGLVVLMTGAGLYLVLSSNGWEQARGVVAAVMVTGLGVSLVALAAFVPLAPGNHVSLVIAAVTGITGYLFGQACRPSLAAVLTAALPLQLAATGWPLAPGALAGLLPSSTLLSLPAAMVAVGLAWLLAVFYEWQEQRPTATKLERDGR